MHHDGIYKTLWDIFIAMAFGDIWTKWMEFTFNFYSSNRKQFETRITQERWKIVFEFFSCPPPPPPFTSLESTLIYCEKISMVQKLYKMEMSNIVNLNLYFCHIWQKFSVLSYPDGDNDCPFFYFFPMARRRRWISWRALETLIL